MKMNIILISLFSGVLLLAAVFPSAAQAGEEWAVVNATEAFMREEPRYGSELVSQTRMGTLVKVLDRSGYWVKIHTPEPYEGWVNSMSLAPSKPQKPYGTTLAAMTAAQAKEYLKAPRLIYTGVDPVKVYKAPGSGELVCTLLMSDIVRPGNPGGTTAPEGWKCVLLPDGCTGWAETDCLEDFEAWARGKSRECDKCRIEGIVALARKFIGLPYLWGGMSANHFDCSGLVGFCFFMNGVLLPRDASQQVNCGVEVSFDQMQAGDLVFFGEKGIAHVGLCVAPGRIIHSSQLVRENSLVAGDPDYYGRRILHIRRIFGHFDKGKGDFRARGIYGSPEYFQLSSHDR